jgi:TetR/AcrR family transcriptional repressor of nem operon
MNDGYGSREKILTCARDLFYFAGYQTTSVDDILRETGVAKSNFYYHFRTKDELGLAVLNLQLVEFERNALAALSNSDEDPARRLGGFCDSLTRAQEQMQRLGGCPFGNLAGALSNRDDDERTARFREALCGVFRQVQAALASCLREGIDSGVFRDDVDAERLAMTVLATVEGLMLMTKMHRSPKPLTQGLPVLQLLLRVH